MSKPMVLRNAWNSIWSIGEISLSSQNTAHMTRTKVLVARAPVEPGTHEVEVRLSGPGADTRNISVSVEPGSFAAVIFTEAR